MDKTIVIVNGYPESGKDTFVEYCKHSLRSSGKSSLSFSSVDRVKQAAMLLGWNGVKDEAGRNFLSTLKDMSTEHYDGPFNYLVTQIAVWKVEYFFLFIREPGEIRKLVEHLDHRTLTVLIDSDRANRTLTNTGDSNVTNYPYDEIIYNNGTLADLEETARIFCMRLIK